jgi:dinuclear metal center YbgI/SA1388 family protein
VADLVARLAQTTSPELAAGWDPVGLQLGNPEARVESVGVAHEVTGAVVTRAVEAGCDLVVAYHPLLFHPIQRLVAGSGPSGRAWSLIRAGVSLLVTHTDFDAAPGGTADSLAAVLGLTDVEPFAAVETGRGSPDGAPSPAALIGRVGGWEGSLGDLVRVVTARLGGAGLRVAGDPEAPVSRVAVVPGSGSSFIQEAHHAGATVIVTGDVDHHRTAAALEAGVAVIDPGHAATERPGMASLVAVVAGWGLPTVDLTGDGRGPWSGPAAQALP